MQKIKLDLLTPQEKKWIEADLSNLFNDPSFKRKIVLGKKTPGTYDPTTGATGDTWTRDAIFGARGTFTSEEVLAGRGVIELGDVFFLVKQSDYMDDLGGELNIGDQVLEKIYSYGKVSVTKNSKQVEGSGTAWVKNAYKGNFFGLTYESDYFQVNTITDDDTLYLKTVYTGETKSRQLYEIFTRWQIVNVIQSVLDITRKIHCRRVK